MNRVVVRGAHSYRSLSSPALEVNTSLMIAHVHFFWLQLDHSPIPPLLVAAVVAQQ